MRMDPPPPELINGGDKSSELAVSLGMPEFWLVSFLVLAAALALGYGISWLAHRKGKSR